MRFWGLVYLLICVRGQPLTIPSGTFAPTKSRRETRTSYVSAKSSVKSLQVMTNTRDASRFEQIHDFHVLQQLSTTLSTPPLWKSTNCVPCQTTTEVFFLSAHATQTQNAKNQISSLFRKRRVQTPTKIIQCRGFPTRNR